MSVSPNIKAAAYEEDEDSCNRGASHNCQGAREAFLRDACFCWSLMGDWKVRRLRIVQQGCGMVETQRAGPVQSSRCPEWTAGSVEPELVQVWKDDLRDEGLGVVSVSFGTH